MKPKSFALPAFLALAACSGGGGGGTSANQFCMAMGSPGADVSCGGFVQSIQHCANAFDGNLDSFAILGISGSTQFVGNAAQQPAGRVAGVFYVTPSDNAYSITITTLLNGAPQESSTAQSPGPGHTCTPEVDCEFSGNAGYVGLKTTLPYDGIQAAISNSGPDEIHVQELCTR